MRVFSWIGALLLVVAAVPAQAYTHHKGPVRWQEYAQTAFERARSEGKPVFMVVSAVWCFNCKIYEETSLADPRVARLLNESYVPVFVDYDRRPDIARRYPGPGIPVTVVFAPDGTPLVSVPGVIPADQLLANLRRTLAYLEEGYRPETRAREAEPTGPAAPPAPEVLERYRQGFGDTLWRARDPAFGGFGLAQKEPRAEVLRRLVERFRGGETRWDEWLRTTLDHVLGRAQRPARRTRPPFQLLLELRRQDTRRLDGVDALQTDHLLAGLLDPVEGGFFRYATRRDWTVPHFEKMLFDNAALIDLLLAAHRAWPDRGYRSPAVATARYVGRRLFDPTEGRFLGSQVADEVYYHLTGEERSRVAPPAVDPTTYAAPSARAAIALLNAARAGGDPGLRRTALAGLGFLVDRMLGPNGVWSYYDPRDGRARLDGQLRDNAWVAAALVRALEEEPGGPYRKALDRVLAILEERLFDPAEGGFFARRSTSQDLYRADELFSPDKPFEENALAAWVFLRAHRITRNDRHLELARLTAGHLLRRVEAGRAEPVSPYLDRVAARLLGSGR
ncbi:DUF255 domain-containing protein [Deferrisoma camini]|uniref:DUF255 domain-containing protein n=1 Tax=Deferrisoma camini TaxID=1035120 RepID=UPI00046D7E10|nr:DUF255 domain-containing protein [Deferrisoma camini]